MTILLSRCVVPLPFSYTWRFHPHIVQFQHYIWQFFCQIGWFPYFLLTLDGSILILCSSNIRCDSSFLTLGGSLTFFSHLMVFILTLCSSNITFNNSFVTFDGSLICFSHLMLPLLHCAVPTSHLTVILLYLVVPLFVSQIWWFHYHIVQFQYQI